MRPLEIEKAGVAGDVERGRLDKVMLAILPRETLSWKDFRRVSKYAIALDGVLREPRRTETGRHSAFVNFDHHAGEDRYTTPSTSKQVYDAVRSNSFFDLFPSAGTKPLTVVVNDCDPDVALAVALIRHAPFVRDVTGRARERLDEIVRITDVLDVYGGISPADLPQSDAMQMQAWLYDPYAQFRMSGKIDDLNSFAYGLVVDDIEKRVFQEVQGIGKRKMLDTKYTVLSRVGKFAVVQEYGYDARTAMYHNGIEVIISVAPLPNGKYRYSVVKFHPDNSFPVDRFLAQMNEEEGLEEFDDRWGGNNGVGGSPRIAGSDRIPEQVEQIARSFLI